jgi:hypothetical protein
MRAAKAYIDQHPEILAEAAPVEANPSKTRSDSKFSKLFAPHHEIPTFVSGFELSSEDRDVMTELFPAGTEAARKMLYAFIHTKARKTQMDVPPLNSGAEEGEMQPERTAARDLESTTKSVISQIGTPAAGSVRTSPLE